jgi:hypothetical protein
LKAPPSDREGHEPSDDRQGASDDEQQPEPADERDEACAQHRPEQLTERRRDVDEAEVAGAVLGERQEVGREREATDMYAPYPTPRSAAAASVVSNPAVRR